MLHNFASVHDHSQLASIDILQANKIPAQCTGGAFTTN